MEDPFPKAGDQAKPTLHNHPQMNTPDSRYPSLNPDRTYEFDEPHPIPDYLKNREGKEGRLPSIYYQLLRIEPRDQIQSKTFDIRGFRQVRRIGVMVFDNKIPQRIRDKNVGNLLANQFSQELQAVRRDPVFDPAQMMGDVRMKIVAKPKSELSATTPEAVDSSAPASDFNLNVAKDKVDAVIIGAVSRYSKEYRDRHGKIKESLGASVEFTAFLVSTKTGKTLWGARFVGTQKPSLANLFNGRHRWLEKDELSRLAIKQIVQDFNQLPRVP